jgi:hypothetical protein
VAILELVISPSLLVRAGLFEHLIEDGPLWGTLRLLALDGSDEIIVEGLLLDLSCLLLLVVLFGPPARALIVVSWCLPLAVLRVEESTDRFFTDSVLRHYIH